MKRHFPLYLKIVLWFLLNLLVMGLVGLMILEGRFGLDLLLSGPVVHRIAGVSESINTELRTHSSSDWHRVLENRSATYGVRFVLFEDDGAQLGGEPTVLPHEVKQRLRGPGDFRGPGTPDKTRVRFEEFRGPGFTNVPPWRFFSRPRFVVRTTSPTRYWIGMPAFLSNEPGEAPRFCTLVIVSKNLYGGGLFFDAKPLLIAGLCALLFSVLFWFPLVRGITHSLGQITRATERIAEGQFDVRVRIPRRDELGQLGAAVNRMAQRLEGFVTGQKRFLGDTAHELCTPLARVQMAVGILEQRANESSQSYVQDVREEVQQMSELVAELLSFSKASLARAELKLQPVNLRTVVEQAVQRENKPGADIRVEVEADLEPVGEPGLLQRAVANLIRNAIRYAGASGSITISAAREGDSIVLTVLDNGPGVPEEALQRLFDPFFRVDDARTRESGGVGLGLTIVRTCVEACGGVVSCRNRQPSGLEVAIRLSTKRQSDKASVLVS
jgi:two-component system sensor histidine kinase CpxA